MRVARNRVVNVNRDAELLQSLLERVCAVLAVALDGGRALRLSLPQELPERLPMTRLAAASPA